MTTPNGPILFNSSTGSDTQSSGLGASNVFGSGASTTGSSAVVTGISTTGVSAGDLLWVQSSSGRQFSVIASVDSSTQVTCDDTFANTESSRTWAIGGKRASIAGSAVGLDDWTADFKSGFTIQFESGYTETFTSRVRARTAVFMIRAEPNASTRPKLTTSNDFVFGQGSGYTVKGIEFLRSSSGGYLVNSGSGGSNAYIQCKFGDSSNLPDRAFNTSVNMIFDRCEFNAANEGLYGSNADIVVRGCDFIGGGKGVSHNGTKGHHSISDCLFNGCDVGIHNNITGGNSYVPKLIQGNIFKCVNAGMQVTANNSYRQRGISCASNIFVDSTYGIEFAASTQPTTSLFSVFDSNAFYNIGTSNYLNDDGNIYNDINLTADPFIDAANGDFNLSAGAGGGAILRANNYALNTDTSVYPLRQYVSDDFDSGGGGGGSIFHPLAQ